MDDLLGSRQMQSQRTEAVMQIFTRTSERCISTNVLSAHRRSGNLLCLHVYFKS